MRHTLTEPYAKTTTAPPYDNNANIQSTLASFRMPLDSAHRKGVTMRTGKYGRTDSSISLPSRLVWSTDA